MNCYKNLLLILSLNLASMPAIHAFSWQDIKTWTTQAKNTSVQFLTTNKADISGCLGLVSMAYSYWHLLRNLSVLGKNSAVKSQMLIYPKFSSKLSKMLQPTNFRKAIIPGLIGSGLLYMRKKWSRENLDEQLAQPLANQIAPANLTTRFTDVIGEVPEDVRILKDMIQNPNQYNDIGRTKGIILHGPPGTGKTLLARAVAGECGCPFFVMAGGEFNQTYRGSGTASLNRLFANARAQGTPEHPSIIFIDEFDAVAAKRTHGQDMRTERDDNATINTLLNLMDGFTPLDNVIVIGATNNIECIDAAVKRAGRFEQHIEVPLPDRPQRRALWDHFLNTNALPVATIDNDIRTQLAAGSTDFTGADIKSVIQTYNRRSRFRRQPRNVATFTTSYNAYVQEYDKGTALDIVELDD